MMAMASRSLTEESGLKNSHFTYIVTCFGASRWMRTNGGLADRAEDAVVDHDVSLSRLLP